MRNGITVRDVMNREFVGISESDRLADAAELMGTESAEAVIVLRGSEPIGTLSPMTALAAMVEADGETPVGEVMEPPVPTISPTSGLSAATRELVGRGASHLLVVEDGEAVGLLTERDVLAATESADMAVENEASAVAETVESDADTESVAGGSIQSVCEVCGSLTPELSSVNGQQVCPDCRAI